MKFRRTTLMSVGFFCVLLGVFVARLGLQTNWLWLGVLCLLPSVRKQRPVAFIAVAIVGFMLGAWRGSVMYGQLQRYQPLYNTFISVTAVVADDAAENQREQLEFSIKNIVHSKKDLPGSLLVSTYDDVSLTRGDRVRVQAKLRPAKGSSRQGYLSAASTTVLSRNTSRFEVLRSRFFTVTNSVLSEPYGSLGLGYVVGLRANIPQGLTDQLALTGLTHIIAVSGYNLTIIIEAVRRLLGKRSAYQSVAVSSLLLVMFVALAGGSPSINRAAVVCGFSLLAWYFGRQFKPVLLLLLSGVVTGMANPLYVWGDPGWYLSFLAFTGVLVLAPLVHQLVSGQKPSSPLVTILIETLCAQLLTLPYVLYLFGEVSIIAPLANVLVLPFVPMIMLGVFVTGCVALLLPPIASIIAIFPQALMALQLEIIERLSQVSFAKTAVEINEIEMLVCFGLIIGVIGLSHRKLKPKPQQNDALTEADNLLQ